MTETRARNFSEEYRREAEKLAAARKRELKLAKRRKARADRNELMYSCGLTRGRDSMGRTIWE